MVTALEARSTLLLLTDRTTVTVTGFLGSTSGSPEARRAELLAVVPNVIAYYSDGSAALGADFYNESRARFGKGRFTAVPVVTDRVVKQRNAVAWASEPLFAGDEAQAAVRLEQIAQSEVARPFRDTISTNRKRDPDSVGWRRVATAGCGFCRMLADRGAVYRSDTVHFAAHDHCHCVSEPVFSGNDTGEQISVMQYIGSKRKRTPAERQKLREYLAEYYPD